MHLYRVTVTLSLYVILSIEERIAGWKSFWSERTCASMIHNILCIPLNDTSFTSHVMENPEPLLETIPKHNHEKLSAHAACHHEYNRQTVPIVDLKRTRSVGAWMFARMFLMFFERTESTWLFLSSSCHMGTGTLCWTTLTRWNPSSHCLRAAM